MRTEKEKMLAGELYDAQDAELALERNQARKLLKEFNKLDEEKVEEKSQLLRKFIPNSKPSLFIQAPFYCDYGYNIVTGENVYFNFNCVVLDVMKVEIGDRTMFGPNVQIYTATHPIQYQERASGLEYAKSIKIGVDVWVGGCTVICPGVSIGDRTVVGAGSVVTKDLPNDVFAAGNPCRVIRTLEK